MVGAGVVGRSPAFALAAAESSVRVMPAGDAGGATASDAAGAILGVLGEVTEHGARARHGRLRTELAVVAARMWPTWREQVRDRAGAGAPRRGGYGTGNFMILKAASSAWTTPRSRAWRTLRPSTGSAATIPPPRGHPGLPAPGQRPRPARPVPGGRRLPGRPRLAGDAGRGLGRAAERASCTARERHRPPRRRLPPRHPDGRLPGPRAVVAAGAWTTPLRETLDPDLPVVPILATAGTAETVAGPQPPPPAVMRTPHRAYAWGLHAAGASASSSTPGSASSTTAWPPPTSLTSSRDPPLPGRPPCHPRGRVCGWPRARTATPCTPPRWPPPLAPTPSAHPPARRCT